MADTVDVNTAPKEALAATLNVSASVADRIVRMRAGRPFENAEALLEVEGVGRATVERIKAMGNVTFRMGDPVRERWVEFVRALQSGAPHPGGATYPLILVQWVLRETYSENLADLAFHAEKVRFYNELKKAVRAEINRARRQLTKVAGGQRRDDFVPLRFTAYPTLDENDQPRVVTTEGEPLTSPEALATHIEELQSMLATAGDDAQLANIDLQNCLQKQQQMLQSMSNVSKMLHDSTMAVIRNQS